MNKPAALWREAPGEPGYEVSSDGRVRSHKRLRNFAPIPTAPRELRPGVDKDGYRRVRLYQSGRGHCEHRIAVLVCTLWHGPRPEGMIVRHLDGNNTNDQQTNLAWGTPLENSEDSRDHGTWLHGEQVNTAVLTEDDVREIRQISGTHKSVAEQYGVSSGAIWQIRSGRTWKHVE